MFETALIAAVLLMASALYLRATRTRLYRQLGEQQNGIRQSGSGFAGVGPAGRTLPSFDSRLAVLPKPLPPEEFERVLRDIEQLATTERSYLPSHKKGGTVAYETLVQSTPAVVQLYQSQALHDLVSAIVGARVEPTPLHDQSSCSVLFYERPGDHIGWHYDHNFYKGRHFTVLIPIVNRDANGTGLSAARLVARIDGEDREIATPPNTLVVFEGAVVLHKATPIADGERRIVLSMTFATDPRNTVLQGITRRIKDMAFFGVRALWT